MMDIRTNSSNNTVYADAGGNIAYFHGNFIPKAGHDVLITPNPLMAVTRKPIGRVYIPLMKIF